MNPSTSVSAATQAESRVTAPVSCVVQKFTPLRMHNLPPNQPVSARRLTALLIFALGAFAVPGPSHAQTTQTVPSSWSLLPAGITSGDSFRLLFVTHGRTAANSPYTADYNLFVSIDIDDFATGSGVPIVGFKDEFRAVISSTAMDARDNIAATGEGVPIYWLNGDKIADNYAGFYDGTWDSTVGRNQRGDIVIPARDVWTGSNNDGTENIEDGISRAVGAGTIRTGSYENAGNVLQGTSSSGRYSRFSLYALSPLITVVATAGKEEEIRLPNREIGYVTLPVTASLEVKEAPETAANNPPAGSEFSLSVDIALGMGIVLSEDATATVCLPTTGVPFGRAAVLYHYDASDSPPWTDISGGSTSTRVGGGFVCGEINEFSPFAVGYATAARLNEQILTRAASAMTASTLAAVSRRVDAAAGGAASRAGGAGTTPALAYQFGGQSSLSGLLKSHGKAMLEDNMEYEQLFDGASFVVPLSADEGGTGGKSGGGTSSLWGSSNFINLGSDNDELDWDGQVISINVGVDKLVGEDMLAGFALSSNQSGFDYIDANNNNAEGKYNYGSTLLHPYIGWFPEEDLKLWASVGFGSGEVEIDTEVSKYSTDTTQQSLSGGFNRWLLNSTELLPGGATTLNLKGDVSMTSVDVEEKTGFAAQKVSSTRLRVLVSGEQPRGLASGGGLTPSLEAGLRYDGGDGVTGVGVELGGGLRYANSGGNVAVAGNVRTLLAHGYDEFGVNFLLQLSPLSGRGLSLSLHPVWGRTQSVAEQLWNDGASEITGEAGSDTSLQSSLDTEVGYGMAATMLGSPGILTPYTGITAQDGGSSRLRLGGRFVGGNGLSVNLEGVQENTTDGASHQVLLRGEVAF